MRKKLSRNDELEYKGFCEYLNKKIYNGFIKITFGRSVYYLTAGEIVLHLPEKIQALGLRRGKAFIRSASFRRRVEAGRAASERKLNQVLGV